MNTATKMFVRDMSVLVRDVDQGVNKCLSDWAPEEPPTTTLFEVLADVIVAHFESLSSARKNQVFDLIERGLSSGDDELETAVATGLIEGMIGTAAREGGNWEIIRPFLRKQSRLHADAWMDI